MMDLQFKCYYLYFILIFQNIGNIHLNMIKLELQLFNKLKKALFQIKNIIMNHG